MDDKQFLLMLMLLCPLISIRDHKGRQVFYICGLTYYIIDHIAEAIRATFGE